MPESTTIDPAALDRLREWGGDKLLRQMVRLFLENSVQRMDQIRLGNSESNMRESERGAHSLKSSAANVGAWGLHALAVEVEKAAEVGNASTVELLLPALEESYAVARRSLESILAELSE
ncbi:MAG: Hpt domain-containing protein [Gemmatimonadota bacterium]|nr:Hpt domain-containing protein [Gemmatimonadota bacterium]MDH5760396.1 Hpt domain-containing protein [Gemmatimonadota bacterium]